MSHPLDVFFNPASVAVIGASTVLHKAGGRRWRSMVEAGFRGPLYPINPSASEILGHRAYPALRDVPGPVDLAIVLVRPELVRGAIEDCVAHEKNINVTLIFSLQRYAEVAEAYIRGLERLVARGGNPANVHSVASFFVSRVDSEADKRLEAVGSKEALALRGKLAIANAKLAYEHYQEAFSGERWEFLASKGANPQRCLWASTSTKNPEYRDVMYVEELIGPDTVNTMPLETVRAFQDHGKVDGDTVTKGVKEAHELFEQIAAVGVEYDDISETLELEGVQKFADSFEELLEGVRSKRGQLAAA
jgi:transaldolase